MRCIAIDCLNCGHVGSVRESALPEYGMKPDASLVESMRRVVGGIGWRLFLWGYRWTDETYSNAKYEDEKAHCLRNGLRL